jgi:hypothetical protein
MENIETSKEQGNIDRDNEYKVEDTEESIINRPEGILDLRYLSMVRKQSIYIS